MKHNPVIIICYTVLVIIVCWAAYLKPNYNWDVLPYMGCILEIDGKDASTIHETVYAEAKKFPPAVAEEFTRSREQDISQLDTHSAYRLAMYQNPDDFHSQIPFYRVRVLYNGLNYLWYKLFGSLAFAIILTSLLSAIGIFVFNYLFLSEHIHGAYLFFLLVIPMILSGVIGSAGLTTPDMLSALFIITAFYFLIVKGSYRLYFIILIASLGVRSDNIILLGLSALFFIAIDRGGRKVYAGYLILASIVYFSLNIVTQYPGWQTVFYHTFVRLIHNTTSFHPHISPVYYIQFLVGSLIYFAINYKESFYPFFLSLQTLAFYHIVKKRGISLRTIIDSAGSVSIPQTKYIYLVGLINITIACRFVLFPILLDRFLTGYFVVLSWIFIII